MKQLKIEYCTLTMADKSYRIEDLYGEDFYSYQDSMVGEYDTHNIYSNELFIYFFQDYIALKRFIQTEAIDTIVIGKAADKKLLAYIIDIAKELDISISRNYWLYSSSVLLDYCKYISSCLYIACYQISIPQTRNIQAYKEKYAIIRTKAAERISKVYRDVEILQEKKESDCCFWKCFSKHKRVLWSLKQLLNCRELDDIYKSVIKVAGKRTAQYCRSFYSIRVAQTRVYSKMLKEIAKHNHEVQFITSNNLDRFALCEEAIIHSVGGTIICVPHGLEYGFRVPHCFIGDVFFTTSRQSEKVLNRLYKTNKFIFDDDVCKRMFGVHVDNYSAQRTVFFTEPDELSTNYQIIESYLNSDTVNSEQLYLKLHPMDKKEHYSLYSGKIKFIDSFPDAICGNICVSRKSTALLEALYNFSIPIAIIICAKDKSVFNTFASLNDKAIRQFYSCEDAWKKVEKIRNGEQ
ncbi:MAG: hypothetical protein RR413_04690 [Christensenellaceae bacterium]